MGGGEVARYMTKYNGAGLVQAGLIASIVPYKLKTADNPHGTELKALEETTRRHQGRPAEVLRGVLQEVLWRRHGRETRERGSAAVVVERGDAGRAQATLACAESFFKTDFRPDLASFKVPTLIIHGTADQNVSIDASARPAAQGIRNSKLIEYEGSPHGLLATDKQRVIDHLLAFLKG